MRIVLLGSGNVANHLGKALYHSEYAVVQVYSRSLEHAQSLAAELECAATDQLDQLFSADCYILAVKDDAIAALAQALPEAGKIVLHTSGSVPLSVVQKYHPHAGVLYPLQTFSKKRAVDFLQVPLCIEASNEITLEKLSLLANAISDEVIEMDSAKRKALHVAAVVAANFSNHLYLQAQTILQEQGLDMDILLPLIKESVAKLSTQSPFEAQTGPARRNDQEVIAQHLAFLESKKGLQELYRVLTASIVETYHSKSK